jgi:mono/diheme cytochrome c family protein
MTRWLVTASAVYLVAAGAAVGSQALGPAEPAPVQSTREERRPGVPGESEPQALLNQYCIGCHNSRAQTGGLALDTVPLDRVEANAEIWEKVIRKVRAGLMPPAGRPRPARATLDAFAGALETAIDRAAATAAYPGRVPLHRMNRAEYANAIRDLLALEVDASTLLPADNSSHGFDNIADVLGVSPSLLERYVSAAAKISRLAVGDREPAAIQVSYAVSGDVSQNQTLDGQPLGTRGGTIIRHNFPVDGEYTFRLSLKRSTGGVFGGSAPGEQLEVTLDGRPVKRFLLEEVPGSFMGGGNGRGGGANRGAGPGSGAEAGRGAAPGRGAASGRSVGAATALESGPQPARPLEERVSIADRLEFRLRVEAGPQTIGVAFLQAAYEANEDLVRRPLSTTYDANIGTQYGYRTVPHLAGVTITGPANAAGVGDTPSRRRIFVCHPPSATAPTESRRSQAIQASEDGCARQILSTLARRAFRRAPQESDVESLLRFFRKERDSSRNFDAGIELALRRILADPEFIFRFEPAPAGVQPGVPYRINDTALASRLSFFLWSSIPDEELLRLAIAGTLHEPAVLEQQTRRMLADPKANALVANFAGQWLYLRDVKGARPDGELFPDFDDNLRQAFQRETELLFDSILRENRSLLDLLDADYTFVNERLAKHYGIPHVYGPYFRRVAVPSDARRGLLGQGSLLLVTSNPNRTSPVIRGKWILENLLGAPPPLPPPDVPAFEERPTATAKSVRERLEQHRRSPTCAGCHQIMDPIGLSLENFDAIGRWRTEDEGVPVDTSSQLSDGTPVSGAAGLRKALLDRSDAFVASLTEKLLMYGVGRETTYADMPVVRAIMRDAAPRQYRLADLVLGVIRSVPFQWRVDAVKRSNDGRKAE